VNHRQLLDGMFAVCGVPEAKFRTICSAVDKLDKEPWEVVRQEMVEQKGLDPAVADRIKHYVHLKGGLDLVETLYQDAQLCANPIAKSGIDAVKQLLEYCALFQVPTANVSFDLSLARGLDYYTGVIYEAVLTGAHVGSVAGGGRYDNLVGMFDPRGGKVPCVGVSIGVERLFAVIEEQAASSGAALRQNQTDVMVVSGQKTMFNERLKLCGELWAAGIKAETSFKKNAKLLDQFQHCELQQVPIALVIGDGELAEGVVKIREVSSRAEHTVKRDEMAAFIKKLLSAGSSS